MGHPKMFASQVRWDRFETKDASRYVDFLEGGKTIRGMYGISTARAAGWVSSSGSASGTVSLPDDKRVCVGIILRGLMPLKIGDKVQVRWNSAQWHNATIKADNGDDTYNVKLYDRNNGEYVVRPRHPVENIRRNMDSTIGARARAGGMTAVSNPSR